MEPTREIPLTQNLVAIVDAADYDAVTAAGRWAAHRNGRGIYAVRNVDKPGGGKTLLRLHAFLTGWPLVDHINGNGLDNRRSNLREATKAQNGQNSGLSTRNKSGFKGVRLIARTGRWIAEIRPNRKTIYLGTFATPDDAARAYDAAAVEHYGEFARLNFPEVDDEA